MRQYKDINTAMTLTNASTLLSVVDNVDLNTSMRGLEATMNSLGMAAKTQADAFANSNRIIDSWSKLAHESAVSATQLVQATEASAGAAHQAGVSFDALQALATSAIRNTGMQGANIGNMLKSLFASIQTDKSEKALQSLDISLKKVGSNGEQEFRPVFDVLLELSQKLQTTDKDQQKVIETISGGRYQWSKVASMLSDYNTIIDAYATSLNSAGAAQNYVQLQMNTLSRDVQRLKDTFTELAAQTDQGGLGEFLKTIVTGLTNLVRGLEEMPRGAGDALLVITSLIVGLKSLNAIMNSIEPMARVFITLFPALATGMRTATAATVAEAVATEGLSAAFTTLDVVSGGLALVIGAVVTGIAAYSMHVGESVTTTKDATQALADKVGMMQEEYQLAQQKEQFMQTAINQEQQLKKALEDTTLSAQNRNKIMNDMVDLYHAVGKATGDEALQQVNASNIKNQSLTAEEQKIKQLVADKQAAYQAAIQANTKEVESDIASANQKINDINAVIKALQNEVQEKANEMGFWDNLKVGVDKTLGTIWGVATGELWGDRAKMNPLYNAANATAKAAHDKALSDAQSQKAQLQNQIAQDQYKLASNKLDAFNIDSSNIEMPSGVPDVTGGGIKGNPLSSTPYEDSSKYLTDQFAVQLRTQDDAIKASEGRMNSYIDTSKQYRDEIQKQIDANKDKQAIVHNEADALRQENVQLQSMLGNQKLSVQQQNDIKKQIDDNNTKLSELGNNWWDFNKTVQDLSDKRTLSSINDQIKNIDSSITPLDDKIKNLNKTIQSQKSSFDDKTSAQVQLVATYEAELNQLNSAISAFEKESQSLSQNTQAWQKNQDQLNQWKNKADSVRTEIENTQFTLTNEIVDELKNGYEAEQQIQENTLKNQFDNQINALQQQKQAVDDLTKSLEAQWQAQDNLNKLQDLQNQLQNEMNNTSYQVIDSSGKISYTYDIQKVANLKKQIADEETKNAHDEQKKQLQDQASALDQQIKKLQDTYNTEKSQLDAYWTDRLQTDKLNTEAENLIRQDGYKQALVDAQNFANQMKQVLSSINSGDISAGAGIAGGLGMSNVSATGKLGDIQKIIQQYGVAWNAATKQDDKNRIHTELYNLLKGSGATYNDSSGEWQYGGEILNGKNAGQMASFDTGGYIPQGKQGIAMLHQNEAVINSPMVDRWNAVMSFIPKLANMANLVTNKNQSLSFNNVHFEFPNVKNPDDAKGFFKNLFQQVYYNAQGGGTL